MDLTTLVAAPPATVGGTDVGQPAAAGSSGIEMGGRVCRDEDLRRVLVDLLRIARRESGQVARRGSSFDG